MKSDPCRARHIRINLKWIKNLNVTAKTIKLLEENIGVNLRDLGFVTGFLDITPHALAKKEKNR